MTVEVLVVETVNRTCSFDAIVQLLAAANMQLLNRDVSAAIGAF